MPTGTDLSAAVGERTAQGLRVLVFARATNPTASLRQPDGRPALPALEPFALVALTDELRPDIPDTIARLSEEGITLKVLSGDDPDTVATIAARAGLLCSQPVHAGHP